MRKGRQKIDQLRLALKACHLHPEGEKKLWYQRDLGQ